MLVFDISTDHIDLGLNMRITLNVDDQLFADLIKTTRAKTKTEAIHIALTEYLRMKRKQDLFSLRGHLDITDDWQSLRALDVQKAEKPF